MVAQISSFPVLNLPKKALKLVFNSLETELKIAFSLCSEDTKKFTESMKMHCERIEIHFDDHIKIMFVEESIESEEDESTYIEEIASIQLIFEVVKDETYVDFEPRIDGYSLKKASYDLNDYIRHMMTIFNRMEIDKVKCQPIDYNVQAVSDALDDIRIKELCIPSDMDRGEIPEILNNILPVKRLKLSSHDPDIIKENFLVQNFDRLELDMMIHLDDLFLINSRSVDVFALKGHFNVDDLSKFIKIWMEGSNPRMKDLKIRFGVGTKTCTTFQNVMARIKYEEYSPRGRILTMTFGKSGIWKIRRRDGTKARIWFRFCPSSNSFDFNMRIVN